MQKSKDTASSSSRSPVARIIAAVLVMALSFMAFDANSLRTAFANEAVEEAAAVAQDNEAQPDDEPATTQPEPETAVEEEQPVGQGVDTTEPEGQTTSASARDGPEAAEDTASTGDGTKAEEGMEESPESDEADADHAADDEAVAAAEPTSLEDEESEADEPVVATAEQVSCTVTFYSDAASQNPSIIARKLVTAEAGQTVVVDVGDVSATPPTTTQAFDGWLYRGDVVRDEITVDPREGNVSLYPSFASGHWIRFSTGVGSGAATEVASQFVGATEAAPSLLPTSSRVGYSFDGWFTGAWNGDTVAYGTQITDGQGAVIDPQGLKERLRNADVELFAKWTGQPTTYRVASWHENSDDEGYSYEGFVVVGDDEGERAVAGETTDVTQLPEVAGFTAGSVEQKVIAGDGSTVVNAYYERNVYSIMFHQGTAKNSPVFENLTITAKYGADVHDRWPDPLASEGAYTASWYTLPDMADDTFVNGISTMPLGGAHFYLKTDSGKNFKTVFMVQDVRGGNAFSAYLTQRFSASYVPGTTPDDYMAIKGFMVNAASEADAEKIRENPVGDKAATHDDRFSTSTPVGTRYHTLTVETDTGDVPRFTAHFYYLRCQYDIVFEENGGPAVADVEGVYYEAPLSGLSPAAYVTGETTRTAPGGMTYEFAGWYDNEELFGDEFDFEGGQMPAGNVVLYAKWVPKSYLVQVDPAGGAFDNPAQSTFFLVSHGDSVGSIGATRDYVADEAGDYVYEYAAFAGDREGSGYARYALAQPGDEGKRYRQEAGVYSLFGWFEQIDGVMSATPFDFNAAVTRDTSIIARWQSEGVFDIAYNPVMQVEGGSVSGDIEVRLDDGYADFSPTYVMNTPTGIESSDGKAYRFVGWKVVESFEEGAPTLVDGLYAEGDYFMVDSELATGNVIHFQAVYAEVPDAGPDPAEPVDPVDPEDGDDGEGGEPEAPDADDPVEPGNPDADDSAEPSEPGGSVSLDTQGNDADGSPVVDDSEANANDGTDATANDDSDAGTDDGSDTDANDADSDESATSSESTASAQQTVSAESLPQTGDPMLALAVAIGGISLIALGVALMARAMRKRHDMLVSEED